MNLRQLVRNFFIQESAPRARRALTVPREFAAPIRPTVLVDGRGKSRYGRRMYQGAQMTRLTADWAVALSSADAEIQVSAMALRARLRQLERDDDYFRSMLWTLENNIVGPQGPKLSVKLKRPDESYDVDRNRAIKSAWRKFGEPENFSRCGRLSCLEVGRMVTRALARDGAILLRKWAGVDNRFRFAVEPIEIDRLDHNYSTAADRNGRRIRFGIELDERSRHVAYHILTRHPGDVFAYRQGVHFRERVPAEDVIAIWTVERAEQTIGMPLWPSVGNRLNQLRRYEEAELVAARVAACKGGFFKRTGEGSEYTGDEDAEGNKISNTEPGQWEELPEGLEPHAIDPNHPVEAFADFMKAQLRGAAAGGNLPYTTIANDLEGVNYSSIRAGLLEVRDGYKYLQELLEIKCYQAIFRAFLPFAALAREIPVSLAELEAVRDVSQFTGRRWAWVDPFNDTRADALAVDRGFTSVRRVVAESAEGGDIEDIFEEQAEDAALAKKHGLTLGAKPAAPPAPGSEPKSPVEGGPPKDADAGDATAKA